MIGIPTNQVTPTYVAVSVANTSTGATETLEVYAGRITFNTSQPAALQKATFRSFVPVDGGQLRTYPKGSIAIATLVTPLTSLTKEDQLIWSVDSFDAQIDSFSGIPGIAGAQNLLALTFTIEIMNVRLPRVGYNITVRSDGQDFSQFQMPNNYLPA